ncbi:MAG TPA: hypothetical protein VK915_12790 [Gaiellaceae bacterium]|nr:hypothetical protein [Gaiellaceae bacterium]
MRKLIAVLTVALAALAFPAATLAAHLHVIQLPNGSCVVLAKDGEERFVVLPSDAFKNTTEPTTTANPHPLHVLVHRGQPGQVQTIAVYGSADDPCAATGNYVNAP